MDIVNTEIWCRYRYQIEAQYISFAYMLCRGGAQFDASRTTKFIFAVYFNPNLGPKKYINALLGIFTVVRVKFDTKLEAHVISQLLVWASSDINKGNFNECGDMYQSSRTNGRCELTAMYGRVR